MTEWSELLKTGGITGAVIAVLLALRPYLPYLIPKRATKADEAWADRIREEERNKTTLRHVIEEKRDQEILKCLAEISADQVEMRKQLTTDHDRIQQKISNVRDIVRDIAMSRGIPVHYSDEG